MAGGLHRPDELDELDEESDAETIVHDDAAALGLTPVPGPRFPTEPRREELAPDDESTQQSLQPVARGPLPRAAAEAATDPDPPRQRGRPQDPLEISGPQPQISGVPPPSMQRTQLDAPMRVSAAGPLVAAVLFHVAVFSLAFILPRLLGGPPPLRKPIIAKLVAQGKPRDQKLMPRREEPTTAPPKAPAMTAPAEPTKVPPKLTTPAPKAPPAAPKAKSLSREEMMNRALAQATRGVDQERHEVKPEDREGAADGSPLGSAANAEEGDQYFAAVREAIFANYLLPSIISERDRMALTATVAAWIARDGTITRYSFEHRSGNHFFDEALELAIKRTKVPPPPADRAAAVARDGVALVFTP